MSSSPFYDKSLSKSKPFEVNLSSLAHIYCEFVSHHKEKVQGVTELEDRLSDLGRQVGSRLYELNFWREKTSKRDNLLLSTLLYITNSFWKSLNGKAADSLEKSVENENEYMIIDNDPMIARYISTPKEISSLNCAAFYCGVIEAVLKANGIVSKVSAHFSPVANNINRTVFLIKVDGSGESEAL